MGAWGHGPFDNDDAMDWVVDFGEEGDWAMVERTLSGVSEADGYVESPEAAMAIAAAETVAAARGKPLQGAPQELLDFAQANASAAERHANLASQALDRILAKDSELCELWEETDLFDAWKEAIAGLKERLR